MKYMSNRTEQLAHKLYENHIISEAEIPVYQYCLDYIRDNLVFFLFICIYASVWRRCYAGLLMWGCLFFLRKFCGGIHASTRRLCNFISYGIIIFAIPSTYIFDFIRTYIWIIIYIIASGILLYLLPVDTPHKRLTKETRTRMRFYGMGTYVIITILWLFFLYQHEILYYGMITVCVMIVTISMLLGEYQNRKEQP